MRELRFGKILMLGAWVLVINLAGMTAAFAFGGCVDSPENPTLLLALLGGAAAGVPWLRRQLKKRRDKHGS